MARRRPLVLVTGGDQELSDGDSVFQPREVTTVSSGTTLAVDTHDIVLVNTGSGGITITLPASPTANTVFTIVNIGSSGNDVTVDPNGNNINGLSANRALQDAMRMTVATDGTDWYIVG